MDEALRTAQRYESYFGKGNFFLELQYHPGIPEQKVVNDGLIEISKKPASTWLPPMTAII